VLEPQELNRRGARHLQEKGLKALRLSDEELVANYLAEDSSSQDGEIYASRQESPRIR